MLCVMPLAATAASASAELSPGQYEYTIKMNMPGVPNLPVQTVLHCISAKDVAGNMAFQAPPTPNTDCKTTDMNQSAGQFSYKISCTKPERMDSTVKGTFTGTALTMDMTMVSAKMPGPMTQTITAKRVGDCKE